MGRTFLYEDNNEYVLKVSWSGRFVFLNKEFISEGMWRRSSFSIDPGDLPSIIKALTKCMYALRVEGVISGEEMEERKTSRPLPDNGNGAGEEAVWEGTKEVVPG